MTITVVAVDKVFELLFFEEFFTLNHLLQLKFSQRFYVAKRSLNRHIEDIVWLTLLAPALVANLHLNLEDLGQTETPIILQYMWIPGVVEDMHQAH